MPAAASEFAEGGVAPMIVLAGGGVAAIVLAAVTDCGTDCAEGSAGGVDFATIEALSGVASCFQKAQRGPDWQPTSATIARTIQRARCAVNLILPGYLFDWLASRSATARQLRGPWRDRPGRSVADWFLRSGRSVEKLVVSKSSARLVGAVYRFGRWRAFCRASGRHGTLAARSRTGARRGL
jgi:hypothetical protein